MNLKTLLTLGMCLQSVKPVQIKQSEKNKIVGLLNNVYNNLLLPGEPREPVLWNYSAEADLRLFIKVRGSNWFFDADTQPYLDFKVRFKMFRIGETPEFAGRNVSYIFHDTSNDRHHNVYKILRHRAVSQRHCFDYTNCDTTQFTNYQSCMRYPIIRAPSLPCSWSWHYYPQMVNQNLKSVACAMLNRPGPYTPNGQANSFVCIGETKDPVNDRPYKLKM